MANCVIVMGASGTGKSTSIQKLSPKETVVINVLGKKLPFKGSSGVYNETNKNYFKLDDYIAINNMLNNINPASYIKNVIIDDLIYCMRKEFFKRAKETGLTA